MKDNMPDFSEWFRVSKNVNRICKKLKPIAEKVKSIQSIKTKSK